MTTASASIPLTRLQRVAGRGWLRALALEVLLAAVVTSLTGLLTGGGWWLLCVFTGGLVFAVAALLRSARVPAGVASLGGGVAGAGFIFIAFGGLRTLEIFVPTAYTWSHFVELADAAFVAVRDESVPSGAEELMFLVAVGSAILAVVLDSLAARVPALCALPVGVVLLVPTFLLNEGVGMFGLAFCGAAYLLLLYWSRSPSRFGSADTGTALRLGGIAVIGALIVGVSAPGFERIGRLSFGSSGVALGTGVSSLIDVGKDLNRPFAVTALQYTTNSSDPPYLRLTSLEDFSGSIWRHRQKPTVRLHDGKALAPVVGTEQATPTMEVTTKVTIENVRTPWLPAPYAPSVVRGLEGTWAFDTLDGTVLGVDTTASDQQYTLVSLVAEPTQDQLRASGGIVPREVRADLLLPERIPEVISRTAREVTRGAATGFDEALALQDHFQSAGFSYTLQAPAVDDRDDGMNVIARFLREKEGYCVHFASAMAVMARVLGIPSRIALGYLPGSRSGTLDGEPVYTVTSDDLHAWPELYFSGVGWVAFEPTVSRSAPAQFTPTASEDAPGTVQRDEPTAGSVEPQIPVAPGDVAAATVDDAPDLWAAATRTALVVFAALIVALAPSVVRAARRRRRLTRIARGRGTIWLAWRELSDTAQDLGIPLDDAQSPRAFATRLNRGRPPGSTPSAAIDALCSQFEFAAYGGGPADAVPHTAQYLREAISGLVADASVVSRWRARLVPVSLLQLRPRTQGSRIGPA